MKVLDLLPKLVKNEDYQIMIADEDNRNIITFNPTGYIGISDALNDRTVEEISITATTIKIFLEPVTDTPVDPEPEPNPTNP